MSASSDPHAWRSGHPGRSWSELAASKDPTFFWRRPRGANGCGGGAQVGAGSAEGPRILLAHDGMASSGGDVLSAAARCCLLKANVAGGDVAKSGPGHYGIGATVAGDRG
jgi:hypothetical protein